LQQRGAGDGVHSILATGDSLVNKVDVQEGQVVPAGTPLLELMPRKTFWVRLGVEPSRVPSLQLNQSVQLFLADGSEPVAGKIRMIAQQVDPETRLAEIFVEPDSHASLLLDAFVRGEIAIEHKPSLLVPRSSVLPDDDNDVLFTVKDGHAVKHTVKVEAQTDTDAAISGEGLKPGDTVITQGNLELDDGMAVTVEGSK
jgi:RND family efflux transporter MFP subunit